MIEIERNGKGLCETTNDVVKVVRCKDCRYGEPEENTNHEVMVMCQNKQNPVGYDDLLMAPDWYCADGERRDDDDRQNNDRWLERDRGRAG